MTRSKSPENTKKGEKKRRTTSRSPKKQTRKKTVSKPNSTDEKVDSNKLFWLELPKIVLLVIMYSF